jgi:hypothetical protein
VQAPINSAMPTAASRIVGASLTVAS